MAYSSRSSVRAIYLAQLEPNVTIPPQVGDAVLRPGCHWRGLWSRGWQSATQPKPGVTESTLRAGLSALREGSPGRVLDGSISRHLSRMSFLTDFTPATPLATWTALSMSSCDLTKPLNWTTPLNVSTLISLTFRVESLKIAAFTFVVITESSTYSPVPSFVAVEPHPQADANNIVRTRIPNPLSGLMAAPPLVEVNSRTLSAGCPRGQAGFHPPFGFPGLP